MEEGERMVVRVGASHAGHGSNKEREEKYGAQGETANPTLSIAGVREGDKELGKGGDDERGQEETSAAAVMPGDGGSSNGDCDDDGAEERDEECPVVAVVVVAAR